MRSKLIVALPLVLSGCVDPLALPPAAVADIEQACARLGEVTAGVRVARWFLPPTTRRGVEAAQGQLVKFCADRPRTIVALGVDAFRAVHTIDQALSGVTPRKRSYRQKIEHALRVLIQWRKNL